MEANGLGGGSNG